MDAQAEKKDMCRRSACVSQAYNRADSGRKNGSYMFFFLFCAKGKEGCSPVFCSGELQRGARAPPIFRTRNTSAFSTHHNQGLRQLFVTVSVDLRV